MGYFIFNGVSSAEFGVLESTKIRKRASRARDCIKIPGRASPLSIQRSELDETVMDFVIGLRGRGNIDAIYKWLSGTGRLITSENTGQYLNATCDDGIDPERAGKRMGKIAVSFRCEPFAYRVDDAPLTVTSTPHLFKTVGSYYSEPLYEITGSGDIMLRIGKTEDQAYITIPDVSGTVYVDVALMQVYTMDTAGKKTSILSSTTGYFERMVLVPSETAFNQLSWMGNVTSVKVHKRERWL